MAEIRPSKIITGRGLMRTINSTFDENIFTIGGVVTGLSSGIPIAVLKSKEKLFRSIAGVSAFAVGVEAPEWLEQENAQLQMENYALRQRIRAVEERLAYIEATIPKERVIILREVSKEEAKKEIRNLFSTGQTLYYSDIAEELRLDLEMVVEICNELQESGEISIDARVS